MVDIVGHEAVPVWLRGWDEYDTRDTGGGDERDAAPRLSTGWMMSILERGEPRDI